MIDFFSIFSKGGIVLWCFRGTQDVFESSINALVKTVFLQERSSVPVFEHGAYKMQYKLDNEFELVFLVGYQKIIQLSYVDKVLSDVHKEFRDRYKNVLARSSVLSCGPDSFEGFDGCFSEIWQNAEANSKTAPPTKMKTFQESQKSQKTVASMISQPNAKQAAQTKQPPASKLPKATAAARPKSSPSPPVDKREMEEPVSNGQSQPADDEVDEIQKNREAFFNRQNKVKAPKKKEIPSPSKPVKKGKEKRVWPMGGSNADVGTLDYSSALPATGTDTTNGVQAHPGMKEDDAYLETNRQFVGQMKGDLDGIEYDSDEDAEEESSDEEQENKATVTAAGGNTSYGFGIFSAFKTLVGNKQLTRESVQPALEKMKEHLIGKNVATDIAEQLCESVGRKLEGKVIGTLSGVTATVKDTLRESLVQLLSPQRRVDILRDVMEARSQRRPYTVVFCGVNGVGKSTNLAKITFWLNENGYKVLIAACDTFRSGAVEQLRTHASHLNHLHPSHVQLYEQGYGKDPAAIAQHAISFATSAGFDVVLVDTAGRMQDNEPLMRSLSKLIIVNQPDLVLFVGEALVGNDGVDQLTKFNQALADHSSVQAAVRGIDGIVLTKFDTIDDKVGAAISMTYITGQPIVFVGTGQTYRDLRNLNANAVVHALLK